MLVNNILPTGTALAGDGEHQSLGRSPISQGWLRGTNEARWEAPSAALAFGTLVRKCGPLLRLTSLLPPLPFLFDGLPNQFKKGRFLLCS